MIARGMWLQGELEVLSATLHDHHLVCMKLKTPGGRMNRGVKCRRFDVGKLRVSDEEESVKSKEY